jgi:hypothetical protein
MVYAVKKPKSEEAKGQPTKAVAKEVVKAAEQQRKQSDGGDNEKKNAKAQRCTTGRKENTEGNNTVALGDKDKERRRDRDSEGKERRRDSTRGPKKVLQTCDEFTIVNYNVRGINTEEKQKKLYQVLGKYRP